LVRSSCRISFLTIAAADRSMFRTFQEKFKITKKACRIKCTILRSIGRMMRIHFQLLLSNYYQRHRLESRSVFKLFDSYLSACDFKTMILRRQEAFL
jgi:hypothetical protein